MSDFPPFTVFAAHHVAEIFRKAIALERVDRDEG
jgi:hypothetical protein